jgi:uncharacterized protein YbjQ (UPF0145 family)
VVRGIVVRATTISQDTRGRSLCESAREQAFRRMVHHAEDVDADGINRHAL